MKQLRNTSALPRSRRRGFLSVELAFTLPILLLVLLALFEFSLLMYARGSLVEASRIGARAATLPGTTPELVETEIQKVLSPRLGQFARVETTLGAQTGDVVRVAVRVPMPAVSPDLLWPIGFSLAGRDLYSETRMIRE